MKRIAVALPAAAIALLAPLSYAAEMASPGCQGACASGTSTIMSTAISIFSLIVAAAAFFLTQLRPPRITSFVGPTATLGYVAGGGFGITIPVTFTNHGARTGAVLRAGVTLWRKDSPNDRYFMQWDSFVKQNFVTNRWDNEEAAHALAVPGKSIVARVISCVWLPTNPQQMIFRTGTYCVSFHYWTGETESHGKTQEVDIAETLLNSLDSKDPAHTRTVLVTLDETVRKNIHLNESEFRKLIDSK